MKVFQLSLIVPEKKRYCHQNARLTKIKKEIKFFFQQNLFYLFLNVENITQRETVFLHMILKTYFKNGYTVKLHHKNVVILQNISKNY